ncbi:hypothetical protein CKAN_01205700 [Cinnamomum micranthum f. kanehirae]|uniref:Uncharacterized protein n=1 Tax=Cinnamomum micranthum f. kanehirae TaxID=337451 RepID=A0A443NXP8_9MAGN|nr:hypothetical protein CKAN_01205700 [Cinnamomum micranthum f. kanehirae]
MYADCTPAQAVLATTPVVLTIRAFNGNMRNNLGTYWIRTIRERVLLERLAVEYFTTGITHQITNCNKKKKERNKNEMTE